MASDDVHHDERLQLSEASFRTLIEESPDAVGVHHGGRFVYVNRRFASLLGYDTPEGLVGKMVMGFVHPDDRGAVEERIRSLDDGGSLVPFAEERLLMKSGTPILVELGGMRIDFHGEPAVVAIVRDMTDRRKREAEAANAGRMAAVGLLAAGVAHEINNPLTFVMLHLENMGRTIGKLREGGRAPGIEQLEGFAKAVDEARFGLERVGSIVRDLRTFARSEEDGQPDLVSVTRVLDIAINLTAHELKYRAKLRRGGDESQAYVIGREGKLCQVFVNLLVNAVQALPSGRDENEVVVETVVEDDVVRILIADNGPGIPRDLVDSIFEPFVSTKGSAGSGLGLSICREIVTAHGGRIEVLNVQGEGASFLIELPHASGRDAPASSRRNTSTPPPMRARVLIVDDEKSIVQLVATILMENYELEVANDGAEAQAILERDPNFDMVLCDVMMPHMSGIQLHAWIEEALPRLATRVLFMNGGDLGPGGRELAEQSPDRFLAKPFTRAELEGRVAKTLKRRRGG